MNTYNSYSDTTFYYHIDCTIFSSILYYFNIVLYLFVFFRSNKNYSNDRFIVYNKNKRLKREVNFAQKLCLADSCIFA